jgi:hypothetical protein
MIFGALLSLLATSIRPLFRFLRDSSAEPGTGGRARIIDPIESVFEYMVWLLQWACWLLDWALRLPLLFLDLLGIGLRVSLAVSVKIVTDDAGVPAVSVEEVRRWLRQTEEILDRCDILLVSRGIVFLPKEDFLASTACGPAGFFRRFFTWFSSHAGGGAHGVTIYVVRSVRHATGCAYPGCDWAVISAGADGTVLFHEIGHLSGLWKHSRDPHNVMTVRSGGSHDRITPGQRAMLRTSRFVRLFARSEREPAR